jgi:hypothetical protein
MYVVAALCLVIVASGCGPTEQEKAERERIARATRNTARVQALCEKYGAVLVDLDSVISQHGALTAAVKHALMPSAGQPVVLRGALTDVDVTADQWQYTVQLGAGSLPAGEYFFDLTCTSDVAARLMAAPEIRNTEWVWLGEPRLAVVCRIEDVVRTKFAVSSSHYEDEPLEISAGTLFTGRGCTIEFEILE